MRKRCADLWNIWSPKARALAILCAQRCRTWWEVWSPKAREYYRWYLKNRSRNVEYSAGCSFLCLVVFAVAGLILWATDKSPKKAKGAPTPTATAAPISKLAHPVPPHTPGLPSTAGVIRTEAEGRAEAVRLYPALGIANSPLNAEFVARYQRYQEEKPELFRDPAWPVILARECALYLLRGQ